MWGERSIRVACQTRACFFLSCGWVCVCDRTGGLPCRRMSSHLTPADGTDERTIQQDNELEALASIFGDDFQDLRNKDPWMVTLAEDISTAATLWCSCAYLSDFSRGISGNPGVCLQVKRPPEVYLCLRPNGLNNGQGCYATVDLQVKCPPSYPDV